MKMQSSEWIAKQIEYDDKNGGRDIDEAVSLLKEDAFNTDCIYHCTNKDALISIIRSKSFWLTSLSHPDLNDPEEVKRIENPEFRNSVFVACFTKSKFPPPTHWDEYGNKEDGVVFRFRKEWIAGDFSVVGDEWSDVKIRKDIRSIKDYDIDSEHVFNASDTGFYSVKYADDVIHQYTKLPLKGKFLHLAATGLVKPKKGNSSRTHVERCWEDEREIRYRTIVQDPLFNRDIDFKRIAVSLTDQAFDSLELAFSPLFPDAEKDSYIVELKDIKPGMNIEVYTIE